MKKKKKQRRYQKPMNEAEPSKEQLEPTPSETAENPEAVGAEPADEQQPERDPEKELQAAVQQRDEYLAMAQRVQADFENYRRRNNSVRADAFEDGAREFIKTILPVMDNLERAAATESSDEQLLSGVKLVWRQLEDALKKRGVTVIDRQGEKFDPSLENAVLQGTPEEGEPGTVCAVLQKGYKLGDTVLRHAMVKVVSEA